MVFADDSFFALKGDWMKSHFIECTSCSMSIAVLLGPELYYPEINHFVLLFLRVGKSEVFVSVYRKANLGEGFPSD